jgi:hypothetical protein
MLRCGLQEMANTEQLGSRGEVWLVAQLVLLGLLVFPPDPLEVGRQCPFSIARMTGISWVHLTLILALTVIPTARPCFTSH